jgi:hypothetical protein
MSLPSGEASPIAETPTPPAGLPAGDYLVTSSALVSIPASGYAECWVGTENSLMFPPDGIFGKLEDTSGHALQGNVGTTDWVTVTEGDQITLWCTGSGGSMLYDASLTAIPVTTVTSGS